MAEEVAQREAVDPLAGKGAREGVALVVEAEASRDAGDRFRGLEVALDRRFRVRPSFRHEEDVLAHHRASAAHIEGRAHARDDREAQGASSCA